MIQQLPKQVPEAAAAAANLAAVQEKAKALQEAAEEAKTAIPELTDAQKAALEIIALEKERAGIPPQTGEKKMSCSK